jgi:hypothetical protein
VSTLLIAGLPGAGKSHFCRWLAAECDFAYIESDSDPVTGALAARDLRVVLAAASEIKDRGPNVALEWGFRPTFVPQVRAVIDIGFDPWWFGGNEAAARRSYSLRVRRDPRAISAFETQPAAIQLSWADIAEVFQEHILPAVDLGPRYMPPEEIYRVMRSG